MSTSSLTADQVATIRSTWSLIGATTDAVAPQFYARLFVREPSLQPLFAHTDLTAQGDKLTHTLAVVVRNADVLHTLGPAIEALGQRHAGYGVVSAHYAVVAEVLLDTFAAVLGDAFPAPAREAWTVALMQIASAMQRGAERVDGVYAVSPS